jgi:HTH-type transcriptional regulator / antitoxin HigA
MELNHVRTDEEHKAALREIERLWGAELGTDSATRLDLLVDAIEAYENFRWPIGSP